MEAEVKRLEAQMRAINAGHPEWVNALPPAGVSLMRRTTAAVKNATATSGCNITKE